MGGGEGGERRHAVIAAANEPFAEVRRHRARVAFALDIDLFHPAAIDKVIHVGTAPGAGERIGHVAQRQPQRDGFVVIDIHLQLRHLRQIVSAHRLQFAALVGRRQQLAAQLHQAVTVGTAAGHQFEGEAVALPETVYRRRGHGEEGGVADRPQLFGGAQGDGLGGVVVPFALRPVFQRHEGHPGVLPAAAKAEAVDGENDIGIGFLFGEEPVGHLAAHLGGTHRGGPGGQGVLDHDLPLVLHRQEAARQLPHRQRHRPANQRVSAHHHCAPAQAAEYAVLVACFRAPPQAVKGAEEPFGVRFGVAEQRAAQRRGEGQRYHHRQHHRRDNGYRELAIDDPGRTAEEGHRQEHRRQHQGNRHQRAGDFAHRFFGGFASGEPFVAHNALHVLHHHDGVIHQQADRQHHGEQRQGVNRVAEQRQHAEGAKQHHRHRHRRNERRAEVLQEQIHHADDEDNRFEQGLNHVLDRDFDELGAVLRIGNIVTLRHLTLEFGDFAFHQRRGVQRVGAGGHHHRDPGGRVAVQIGGGGVILATHLHPRDIAQAYYRAVGLAFHDDRFELVRGLQPGLRAHGGG